MIAALSAAVLVLVAWRIDSTLRTVERHVAALRDQLDSSRRAHDHQLAELHRRLDGIQAAASRAEAEARAVSDQLGVIGGHCTLSLEPAQEQS